ncbi:MAG TPA: AMP-binding protein, partial [Gemmatimonadota bacterium]|nr:AMP-binding protein [Gemmatimonadota bacterium]
MGSQDLKALEHLPAADAVARIEAALADTQQQGPTDPGALELDREAIRVIQSAEGRDAILEQLDLESLAGILERCVDRLEEEDQPADLGLRELTWEALDLVRRPAILRRISASGATGLWSQRILSAVEASHLTFGPLFRQRARDYEDKILFEIPTPTGGESLTWSYVAERVETLARALTSLVGTESPDRIAILSENRLEVALLDHACLTSGLVNVVVPANATDTDVGYILRHAKVGAVIVSDREQLAKVDKNRASLPYLKHVVALEPQSGAGASLMTLAELEKLAETVPASLVAERSLAVRIGDLATVMYTSGTTGTPKGIQYSQRNIVFKRFARALALPEIGEEDVFLSYLPLFHTFGRYLELMGCVFWGAKYCFLLDPSMGALIDRMTRYRPTVFISVPRKWMQLYDAIAQRADPLEAPDDELLEVTREVTGGRLAWGLSAAGYLDPEIFKFFHRQGIQLLSGFGMSEATGGVTMTPPREYKDHSLGVALP